MIKKRKLPIQGVINWYFGNYCMRKCFDDNKKLQDHHQKLQLFVEKNKNLKITNKEFLFLFNNHMRICNLEYHFKCKMISWKLMERLQHTPRYDNTKISVKEGKLLLNQKPLPARKHSCPICNKLGIR